MNKLVLLAGLLIACGGPAIPPVAPPPAAAAPATRPSAGESRPARASLYARLGGKPAITAVTGELLDRVAADARIRYRFLNTDLGKLKASLIDFVCMATGGPCKYTGQDMETSHAGMELVDDEFTALVEDLAGALDRFKVPAREKAELLGALAPLQPAIVTPPGRLKPVDDAAIARATAVAVKLTDENAIELMQAAIVAVRRGQRNYADLLFSHVEAIVGAAAVAAAARTFRDGAPPRLETPVRRMPRDTPPGSSRACSASGRIGSSWSPTAALPPSATTRSPRRRWRSASSAYSPARGAPSSDMTGRRHDQALESTRASISSAVSAVGAASSARRSAA